MTHLCFIIKMHLYTYYSNYKANQQFVLVVTAVKKSNMAHAKFVVLGPPMLGRFIEA